MNYLTNEKLVIVGAGGMIGSNMVQTALTLGLTPNICLYDIYEPGVHGVFDEMEQCAFPGANLSYTVDPAEAFTGFSSIIYLDTNVYKATGDKSKKETSFIKSLAPIVGDLATIPMANYLVTKIPFTQLSNASQQMLF